MVLKIGYLIEKEMSHVVYHSILFAVLTMILHSFLDFDLSFYYLLFITFVCFGILNTFPNSTVDSKKAGKENWITKGIFIGINILFLCMNIKLFWSDIELRYKVTVETSFEEKYNLYRKWNQKLPYNREFKVKQIKLIEAYQVKYPEKDILYTEEILENVKALLKHEKYYERFDMQTRFINCSLHLLGQGKNEEMIKNIEEGLNLFQKNKVQRRYNSYSYLKRMSEINQTAQKLLEKSQIVEKELEQIQLRELARKFYQLNLDEYEESKTYIEESMKANEEQEEYLKALLEYKQKAQNQIEEIEKNGTKI